MLSIIFRFFFFLFQIDDFDNFDNFPNTDSTVDHNSAQAASIEKISISKSGPIEAQPIFKTKEIVLSSLLRDPRLFRNRNFEPIATNPKLLVTNHTKKDNDCRATTVSNVSPLTFPSIEQGTNPKEAEIVDNMDENIDECGKDEEVVLLSPRSRDPRLLKNRNATKSKVAKINQEKCDNDCRVTDVSIASPITSPLPLTEHNSNDKEAVIDDNSDENIDEFDEDDDILSIFDEEENHIFADESDNGEPSSKRLCTFSQNTKTKNVITSTNDKTNKKNAIEKLDQTPKTMPSTSSCNNSNESIFKIPKLVNNDRSNPIEIEKKSLILTKRKTPTPVVNRKLSLQSLLPGFHLINANRVPIKQRLGQLKNINSARMLLKPNQNATVVTASPAVSLPPEQVEKTIQAAEQLLQKSQNAQQLNKLPEKIASKETVSNCSYLMPSFVVNPYEKEPAFNVLFMNVCRNFINGGCTLNPARCPFIHTMPENDFFRQALNKIGQKHVIETYNVFILRCPKLFEKYFPEFCDYFGSNSLEQQLIQMVNDCTYVERRIFMFLKNIVNAFVKMGMPYSMALRKLIGAIKKRTIPTTHTVLKLILDRQNKNLKPFFDILQSMTEMDGFVFPTEAINRLLLVYDQEKNQNLLHIIWLIIANLTPESQQNIDGDLFTAFLDNLTKNIGPEYKMSRLAEKIVPTN